MIKEEYYHINQIVNYGITPIDIGHSTDTLWNVEDNLPFYSLNFMVQGKAHITYKGKNYIANEGDVFIVPPNENIIYKNLENELIEIYWINFNGLNCKSILNKIKFEDGNIVKTINKDKLIKIFTELFSKMTNKNIRDISAISALYYIFQFLIEESPQPTQLTEVKPTGFQEIINKIDEIKFKSTISEEMVANMCFISREHFSRIFFKNMGVNFVSYINLERIKKASEFLENTNLSVKEISYSIGYSNVYYFCRLFKKYRLLTPTQYRNKMQEKSA